MSRSVGSEGLLVKVVVPKSKIKITWWHHKWLFCQISGSLLSHRRRNCFPLVLHYILYVFHSILFWCRWKQTSVERRELPLLSGACRGIDQSLLHISINCSFTETINTYDITTLISTGEESTGLGITAADFELIATRGFFRPSDLTDYTFSQWLYTFYIFKTFVKKWYQSIT